MSDCCRFQSYYGVNKSFFWWDDICYALDQCCFTSSLSQSAFIYSYSSNVACLAESTKNNLIVFGFPSQWSNPRSTALKVNTPTIKQMRHGYVLMAFNSTFNNISVVSWQQVLLVEETGVPGENQTSHKSLTNFIT